MLANYTMPHGLSSDEKKLIYSNGSLPDIIPQKLDSKEKVQKWHNCFWNIRLCPKSRQLDDDIYGKNYWGSLVLEYILSKNFMWALLMKDDYEDNGHSNCHWRGTT